MGNIFADREREDTFDEDEVIVSTTECTGLKITPPLDEIEDINESSLYAIHSAKDDETKEKKCKKEKAQDRR